MYASLPPVSARIRASSCGAYSPFLRRSHSSIRYSRGWRTRRASSNFDSSTPASPATGGAACRAWSRATIDRPSCTSRSSTDDAATPPPRACAMRSIMPTLPAAPAAATGEGHYHTDLCWP